MSAITIIVEWHSQGISPIHHPLFQLRLAAAFEAFEAGESGAAVSSVSFWMWQEEKA